MILITKDWVVYKAFKTMLDAQKHIEKLVKMSISKGKSIEKGTGWYVIDGIDFTYTTQNEQNNQRA